MIYLDTSVLVSLLVPEPDSVAVRRWLAANETDGLITSDWTVLEFGSALGLKVRGKGLKIQHALAARQYLENLIEESLQVETPTRAAYSHAVELVARPRAELRAGDALHLAVAAETGARRFITLDRKLLKAAGHLRLSFKAIDPSQ